MSILDLCAWNCRLSRLMHAHTSRMRYALSINRLFDHEFLNCTVSTVTSDQKSNDIWLNHKGKNGRNVLFWLLFLNCINWSESQTSRTAEKSHFQLDYQLRFRHVNNKYYLKFKETIRTSTSTNDHTSVATRMAKTSLVYLHEEKAWKEQQAWGVP